VTLALKVVMQIDWDLVSVILLFVDFCPSKKKDPFCMKYKKYRVDIYSDALENH